MAVHSLKSVQKIPASLTEVWDVFSSPANLQRITPAGMNFKTISRHHGDKIYTGQIIEYKLSPLWGIPVYWMTEITHVEERKYFIDVQRKGPYSLWQHQHHFREIEGGVEMTDIVHYRNPLWKAGKWINTLIVRKKLRQVFEHRFRKVEEIFGPWPGGHEMNVELY